MDRTGIATRLLEHQIAVPENVRRIVDELDVDRRRFSAVQAATCGTLAALMIQHFVDVPAPFK